MAWLQVKERMLAIAEALTPASKPSNRFKRLNNRTKVANVAATSGAFRRCRVLAGSHVRGSAVVGIGAKQVIHSVGFEVSYPDTGTEDYEDLIEQDAQQLRAALEDSRNYLFGTTGLQNIEVTGVAKASTEGKQVLQLECNVIYVGAN